MPLEVGRGENRRSRAIFGIGDVILHASNINSASLLAGPDREMTTVDDYSKYSSTIPSRHKIQFMFLLLRLCYG